MFYNNSFRAFREESETIDQTQQLFDSEDAVETAEELNDALESVPTANEDGVGEFKAAMFPVVQTESACYGRRSRKKFFIESTMLQHFMESEGIEDASDAVDAIVDANNCSEDDEGNSVEIDKADVVVVAPSDEEVKEIVDDAVQEAKLSRSCRKPAQKKLKKVSKMVKDLKNKGIPIVKKKSKCKR